MERAKGIIEVCYNHGIEVVEEPDDRKPYAVYVHNQWAGEFYNLKQAAFEAYKHLPADVQRHVLFQ